MRTLAISVTALATGMLASPATAQTPEPTVIQVPGFADFLAPDGKTVWVTNKGRVEQWSLKKGKLAEVPMTHPCGAMVIVDHDLWVGDCKEGTLTRIDTRTAKIVATVPSGIGKTGEMNVVYGAGSVWVVSDSKGVLSRVDPATNTVVATIAVDPDSSYMTFGFGSVWVVSLPGKSIQKVDPATNLVVKRTALGKEPGFLAAGEGAVWVQEQGDGTVARIDPETGEVSGRIKIGDNLKWGDIDTGAGKVWLRTTDDQVFVVVDAKTLEIRARLGKPSGSGALRYTRAGVWTTAHDQHTLSWWPQPNKIGE